MIVEASDTHNYHLALNECYIAWVLGYFINFFLPSFVTTLVNSANKKKNVQRPYNICTCFCLASYRPFSASKHSPAPFSQTVTRVVCEAKFTAKDLNA
jgi:hypothetical protein